MCAHFPETNGKSFRRRNSAPVIGVHPIHCWADLFKDGVEFGGLQSEVTLETILVVAILLKKTVKFTQLAPSFNCRMYPAFAPLQECIEECINRRRAANLLRRIISKYRLRATNKAGLMIHKAVVGKSCSISW